MIVAAGSTFEATLTDAPPGATVLVGLYDPPSTTAVIAPAAAAEGPAGQYERELVAPGVGEYVAVWTLDGDTIATEVVSVYSLAQPFAASGARGLPRRILVHVATPIETVNDPAAVVWVEGKPGAAASDVEGAPFRCVLFLPNASESAGEEQSWRPRQITRPTLLYNLRRGDLSFVSLTKDSRLSIEAPDLEVVTQAGTVLWQLDGDPQPFGKPGRPFAAQATLKRIED